MLHGPGGLRAGWRILLFIGVAVSLAVVGMVLAAALGLAQAAWMINLVATLAAVGGGVVMLRMVDDRPAAALGLGVGPHALRETGLGLAVGAGSLLLVVGLVVLAGGYAWVPDGGTGAEYAVVLASGLLSFTVAAAVEEVVFRGYAFQALVQGIGPWPTLLLTSVLFAGAHGANPNLSVFAFANLFAAGIMLGVAYLRTRSLWFVTAMHLAWNWVMSSVLDLPVSGIANDTPLYSSVETGADWWTGGAFGPEGGAAATLAMLLVTAWMLRSRRLDEAPEIRAARPLVDDRLGPAWPR